MQPAANAGQIVLETTIAADNWTRVFLRADAGHVVFKTIIILHHWPCVFPGPNTNARATISVTAVPLHQRRTTLTDADARADVGVARVADHLRARAIVSDAGIKILETKIPLNQRRRAPHRANTATHVSVAHVTRDARRHLPPLRPRDADARIADVMHDVVFHHTRVPHLNACRSGRADVLVFLIIALGRVMLFPKPLVIPPHARDRESIQHGAFGHQHARPLAFRVIQNCRLRPRQPKLAFRRVAYTAHDDARLEFQSLPILARRHQHRVARRRRVDRRLDTSELPGYLELRRRNRQGSKHQGRADKPT